MILPSIALDGRECIFPVRLNSFMYLNCVKWTPPVICHCHLVNCCLPSVPPSRTIRKKKNTIRNVQEKKRWILSGREINKKKEKNKTVMRIIALCGSSDLWNVYLWSDQCILSDACASVLCVLILGIFCGFLEINSI